MARVLDRGRHSDHSKQQAGRLSVRVTLYGKADKKIADRAIKFVQREKRRHFHLND